MSCVPRFYNIILFVFVWCILAATGMVFAEVEIPFLQTWPTWKESPVSGLGSGFGLSFWRAQKEVDENLYQAFGRWDFGFYGGGFSYRYLEMDSLYRQSFGRLNSSLLWKYGGVGAGYGLSMEWLPGQSLWSRHLYSAGALGRWREVSFGLWLEGFTDESPRWYGSLDFSPVENLRLFAESNLDYVLVGYAFSYSIFQLTSVFRTPGFAVSLGISVTLDHWSLGGSRDFSGQELGWNGIWLVKSLRK